MSAHLYDATDSLTQLGLAEDEAFMIACKRLGNEEVLTEEYSKVNPSIKMNKVWAYLLIGFNLFYSLPSLLLLAISILYLAVYESYGTTYFSAIIITSFHLLVTIGIWYIIKRKKELSQFIESQVRQNPLRIVGFSFVPYFIPILLRIIPSFRMNQVEIKSALNFPIYKFNNSLVEFTCYIVLLSVIGAISSLVFTINKSENLTLKTLFERPSSWFLISFGIILELFAASTRSIRTDSIWLNALIFGLVYLSASYLITYYNSSKLINRYLLTTIAFGLIMETAGGIHADIGRGNTVNTVYFVSFMLIGIVLGKLLGLRSAKLVVNCN